MHSLSSLRRTEKVYLVSQALARARAHGVHPQVGVHVVGADARVRVGDGGHYSEQQLHPHARAREEPDPSRDQPPAHGAVRVSGTNTAYTPTKVSERMNKTKPGSRGYTRSRWSHVALQ